MSPAFRTGAIGFGLIAVCYGFARFAFGLLLPQIGADLALGPELRGAIAGSAFATYCVTIIASAYLTERVGATVVATIAAIVAAIGMAGIALAPSALILAISVMVAGASTGLASPPMAAVVAAAVPPSGQDGTNTTINAGASVGVALSGPIALAMAEQWRLGFAVFAAMAAILAVITAALLPNAQTGKRVAGAPVTSTSLLRLIAATFLMGAASTAVWSFGGELVSRQPAWEPAGVSLLWSCIGLGGITGIWAGGCIARFGLVPVHWTFLVLMATAILSFGSGAGTPAMVLLGGAVFGAAYVMLTGIYLVWGVRTLADRPATGLMIAFLTIAIGQTVGAPLFGLLLGSFGAMPSVATFAAFALAAGCAPENTAKSGI